MDKQSSYLDELLRITGKFKDQSVLVVGDLMLDRYLWGAVSRISPEAPVPVVELSGETTRLGGAANVAGNIVSLGAKAQVLGVIGDDEQGKHLLSELGKCGIPSDSVLIDSGRPTSVKTRIIAHNQQVVRTDLESREDLSVSLSQRLIERMKDRISGSNVVIISDYGKGVMTDSVLNAIISEARSRNVPVCVDPKETRLLSYSNVNVITPNQHEAGFAYGRKIVDETTLEEVGWGLSKRLGCDGVLITRGEKGMSLFEKGKGCWHLPTVAREVFDVTGAGDTVVTAFGLALAAGATLKQAASISNHAAGVVIKELGTATATVKSLLESFNENGEWSGW
jgi:rfaE bifunctional protein kinase chain/domain